MRLVELLPRWVHVDMFAFLCPHCFKAILTCKRVVMGGREQWRVLGSAFGEDANLFVVPCAEACAWEMTDTDFDTITVTPSLDASASGHWHGHITAGAIVGGEIKQL